MLILLVNHNLSKWMSYRKSCTLTVSLCYSKSSTWASHRWSTSRSLATVPNTHSRWGVFSKWCLSVIVWTWNKYTCKLIVYEKDISHICTWQWQEYAFLTFSFASCQEFVEKFRILLPKGATEAPEHITKLFERMEINKSSYQIGKTKVSVLTAVKIILILTPAVWRKQCHGWNCTTTMIDEDTERLT